tara:strand:+ start:1551 stop:2264 length:714 start_codon:yes stop_codon:yes gene_type:complete
MTKQKEEKPEEEHLSKDEIFELLQSERNKYFIWDYYDDHDEVHFLGSLADQLDYILGVCTYMVDYDDDEKSTWVRGNTRTRLADMWDGIDSLYEDEVTPRIIYNLNAEALWFNDRDYLDSKLFFESYIDVLFDILEHPDCHKRQLYKKVLPPHGCPSLEEVINHDGKEIELLEEQVKKYIASDWAESAKDIIKWVALKYTFKGDHKSCENLYSNYKRMGVYRRNESVKQAKSPKKLY